TSSPAPRSSTLSLHDALPILVRLEHRLLVLQDRRHPVEPEPRVDVVPRQRLERRAAAVDRIPTHPLVVLHEDEVPVLEEALVLRSEEHTSELQSPYDLVCRLL